MIKITDKLEFKHRPIVLAPMEGVSNMPFRIICKENGADIVYTEFTSSEALTRDVKKSHEKLKFTEKERPLGIQVFGSDIDIIRRSAIDVVEKYEPDILDINCGCPVSKVTAKGSGSGFLQNINLLKLLAEAVVPSVNIPVTVKMRIGWDSNSIIVEEAVKILRDAGVQIVTIHARTRAQMYKGEADWSWLRKAKEAAPDLTIFGNGDVKSPEDAKRMFEETNVDGIMIGRGAIDNPWIFREVKHFLETGEHLEPATIEMRINALIHHIEMTEAIKGERRTATDIRKHYGGYLRGVRNIKHLRGDLMQSNELAPVYDRLERFKEEIKSGIEF
jgi:tRNA-dihydrouridine synthase B